MKRIYNDFQHLILCKIDKLFPIELNNIMQNMAENDQDYNKLVNDIFSND